MVIHSRVWDAVALLGVLLLLVQVPAHAGAADERVVIDEREVYDFPAPRVGDRIVHEAWVVSDGAPVRFGPVQEASVKMAEPWEVPVAALYVIEERTFPVNESFAWGRYMQEAATQRTYFDETGFPVWTVTTSGADGSHIESKRGPGPREDIHSHAGARVYVEPDRGGAIAGQLAATLLAGVNSGFTEESRDLFIVESARVNGFVVHEAKPTTKGLDGNDPHTSGWSSGGGGPAWLDDASDLSHRIHYYDWFSPQSPFVAVQHVGLWDGVTESSMIDVWQVPTAIERGTGPDLPLMPYEQRFGEPAPKADYLERDDAAITTPLEEIWTDPRPLAYGVTMADLHTAARMLGPDAGGPRADAVLLDLYWQHNQTFVAEPSGDDTAVPPIPVPPLQTTPAPLDPTPETQRSVWLTTWADPSTGATTVLRSVFDTDLRGTRLVEATNVCDEEPTDLAALQWSCRWELPAHTLDPQRLVVAPWDAIARNDQLANDHAAELNAGLWAASFHWFEGSQYQAAVIVPPALSLHRHFMWGNETQMTLPDGAFVSWHGDAVTKAILVTDLGGGRVHQIIVEPAAETTTPAIGPSAQSTEGEPLTKIPRASQRLVAGAVLLTMVGLLARVMAWAAAGGSFPFVAALFSRIEKDKALNHERRSLLVELVQAQPGSTASDLARQTGWGWGTVVHHVETLQRNRLLVHVQNGRRRCFFVADGGSSVAKIRTASLNHPKEGPFLLAVEANPGASLAELCKTLRQGKPGLSRTGSRLERKGLVQKRREGRTLRYLPAYEVL